MERLKIISSFVLSLSIFFFACILLFFTMEIRKVSGLLPDTLKRIEIFSKNLNSSGIIDESREIRLALPAIIEESREIRLSIPSIIEETEKVRKTVPDILKETRAIVEETSKIRKTLPEALENTKEITANIEAVSDKIPALVRESQAIRHDLPPVLNEVKEVREIIPSILEEVRETRIAYPKMLAETNKVIGKAGDIGKDSAAGAVEGTIKGIVTTPFKIIKAPLDKTLNKTRDLLNEPKEK